MFKKMICLLYTLLGAWVGLPAFSQLNDPITDMHIPTCYVLEPMFSARRGPGHFSQFLPVLDSSACNDTLGMKGAERVQIQMSSPRPDQTDLISLGVDPATLVPQGIDLNFFPSFPLSDELSLIPALSYGIDSQLTRIGHLRYGAPKQWRTHYGELVRLVSRLDAHKFPLGRKTNGDFGDFGQRRPVPYEVQTFFINAAGQEVNFYPDPDQFKDADPMGEPTLENEGDFLAGDNILVWYSENGRYRLQDMTPGADNFSFQIQTPEGLRFEFERYKVVRDSERESLAIHYRAHKISDRYGNFIVIEPDDPAAIEPREVKGYAEGASLGDPLLTIAYEYTSLGGQKVLSKIRVPKYAQNESTVTGPAGESLFEFFYPDHEELCKESELPTVNVNGSGNSIALNSIYESSSEDEAHVTGTTIEMDFSVLPQLLHVALDSHGETAPDAASSFMFRVFRTEPPAKEFIFRIDTDKAEQLQFLQDRFILPILYRYQRFPESGREDQPDAVRVMQIGGTPFSAGDEGFYGIEIFPIVKNGDRVVVPDTSGNQVAEVALTYTATDIDTAAIPLAAPGLPGGAMAYHIREDNFFRIAEIRFPEEGGMSTGRKRLVLGYDDNSLNHQEIRSVKLFHGQQLLSQTLYDYQRVRVFTGSEDVYQFFAGEDSPFSQVAVNPQWTLCRIDHTLPFGPDLDLGLRFAREEEIDLLRGKQVRFLHDPDAAEPDASRALITRYGGAYHIVLAGGKDANEEPLENLDCELVQWGLDGKLFDFTWEIAPDGSAKVFDLSPKGLGMDGAMANYNRRRRVFKTYRFDTRFGQNMALEHDSAYNNETPFYSFLPFYTSQTGTVDAAVWPTDHSIPSLEDIFGWKDSGGARAIGAEITAFETVPGFKYRQSTGPTNPYDFFRRESLQLLYGHLEPDMGQHAGQRVSVIRLLDNAANPDQEAEKLFKGRVVTSHSLNFGSGNLVAVAITWGLGGRLDFGNRYAPYFDRQKLLRLQPHFSYKLRNYEGFDWDTGKGILAFDPDQHFLRGTRHGNGGYLGQWTAGSDVAFPPQNFSDQGTLQISGLDFTPRPNDIFFHRMLVYTVTDYSGATLTFTPSLRFDLEVDQVLEFFRAFNPSWTAGVAVVANGYIGHDSFGNNGYQERYYGKNPSLDWASTQADAALVPRFQSALADAVSWNDSTEPANQDLAGWNYFGRVSKTFAGHIQPFFDFSGTGPSVQKQGAFTGLVTSTEFNSPFPWKPSSFTEYYRPLENVSLPLAPAPPPHDEDNLTSYTYVTDTPALAQGKVQEQKQSRRVDAATFSGIQRGYDAFGRLQFEETASFQSGGSDFGLQSEFFRDGNTGLPMRETIRVGRPIYSAPVWTLQAPRLQGHSLREYDDLGRETKAYAHDAADLLFGPVTHGQYPSPLQTRTLTTEDLSGTQQLSGNTLYRDGLERELLNVNQFGTAGKLHVTGTTYDLAGRLDKTFFSREFTTLTSRNPDILLGAAAAYSRTRYNDRGEAAGTVVYDGPRLESSSWTFTRQNPTNGNDVIFQFSQDQAVAGATRVNIKQQQPDRFGNLATIHDFERSGGPIFEDLSSAASFLEAQLVADGGSLLILNAQTRADYAFDRFGNVIQAQVGLANPQTRQFQFDQRGRLRFEDHPEMDHNVAYHDHDLFDMPRLIDYQGGRTASWQYDARGNPISVDHAENQVVKLSHRWAYTDWFSNFPGLVSVAQSYDDAGEGVAYMFDYEPNRGFFTQKQMLHNLPGFSAGYSANVTSAPDWPNSLKLVYTYDDLGRVATQTYPAAVEGNPDGETRLVFHYSEPKGLLDRVEDSSLNLPALFDNLTYGSGDRLKQFAFGPADNHKVSKTWDSFNRLSGLGFHLDNLAIPNLTSDYQYDERGKIKRIGSNWLTELGADKVNRYGYDSLGQLVTARVPVREGVSAQLYDFAFEYDNEGLGNLQTYRRNATAIYQDAVDLATNRLKTSLGFAYNAHGEMTAARDPNTQENFTLAYLTHGRVKSIAKGGAVESYAYDAAGMRVYKSLDTPAQARLYFYDEQNQVLTEWVHQEGQERWDRSYLMLAGNHVVTYEYDPLPAQESLPPGEAETLPKSYVPPPKLLTEATMTATPVLRWGKTEGQEVYDLQIAQIVEGTLEIRKALPGIKGTRVRVALKDGDYVHRVRVAGANWGPWQAFTLASGELPAPENLTAMLADATSIQLQWDPSAGSSQAPFYFVERSTDAATWTRTATLANQTSYLDTGLLPGNLYYYRVALGKVAGGESVSPDSAIAGALVPSPPTLNFTFETDAQGWTGNGQLTAFSFPGGVLTTQSTGNDPIILSPALSFAGDAATLIEIRMGSTGGSGVFFWKTESNPSFSAERQKNFSLNNDGTFHSYILDLSSHPQWAGQEIIGIRLDPTNVTGVSLGIDSIQNKAAPEAPTNLTAVTLGSDSIRLQWSDQAIDETGFKIERGRTGSGLWQEIADLDADTTTFVSDQLRGGKSYDYRVRAYHTRGHSLYSPIASATTDPALVLPFTFDPGTQGFTAGYDLIPLSVANGIISTKSTGNDPYTIGPLTRFYGDEVSGIHIRMKTSAGPAAKLYWLTAGDSAFSEDRSKTFPLLSDGAFHDYELLLAGHPQWDGQEIVQLRLDPTNVAGAGVELDEITGRSSRVLAFHFEKDAEGWVPNGQLIGASVSGGILRMTSTGNDPSLVNTAIFFPADAVPWLYFRLKADAGTAARLYWQTMGDVGFSASKSKDIPGLITDGAFHGYSLDLANHAQWTGKQITALRLDPTNASGNIEIDSILDFLPPQ